MAWMLPSVLLLALMGAGLTSCNPDGSINVTPNSYMSATMGDSTNLNDSTWTANGTRGVRLNNILTVTGTGLTGDNLIILTMPATVQPGAYSISSTALGGAYTAKYSANLNTAFESTSGRLTITVHDTEAERIEGTFEFNAIGGNSGGSVGLRAVVSDGRFGASY